MAYYSDKEGAFRLFRKRSFLNSSRQPIAEAARS
jgi:hypothetical protein